MNRINLKWIPKKSQLLMVLLLGILCIVIAIPTQKTKNTENSEEISTGNATNDAENLASYEEQLEEKLSQTLQAMDGVGKVTVMITLKSSEENIVASDKQSSSSDAISEGADSTVTNRDVTASSTSIYNQNTDGSQTPYVSKQLLPKVEGVVVLADGGDNGVVVENITSAVQALFGIEVHKIKVVKRTHS